MTLFVSGSALVLTSYSLSFSVMILEACWKRPLFGIDFEGRISLYINTNFLYCLPIVAPLIKYQDRA